MIKNYFYLLRHVIELNKVLSDSSVNEFYSQEKDNLNICLGSKQYPHRHLIISADQNLPYILVKNDLRRAKKNTLNFWDEYLPDNLINIEIALNERVIKFNFSKFKLYLIIRGNLTNIILINNSIEISTFKKSKQDNAFLLNLINGLTFVSLPEKVFNEFENIDLCDFPTFRKRYPHIGREIYEEAISLLENNSAGSFCECLKGGSKKIIKDKIVVHYEKNTGQINLAPQSFKMFKDISSHNIFNDFNSAVKFYISEYFQNFEYNKLSKELYSYFDKELHRLSEKINKLKFRIESGSKETEYRKLGNLLLANIYKISKGQQSISVNDYESGEEIKIKLKETNTPNQNVNLYFDKAKDEKINFAVSYELYTQSINKHAVLLKQQSILNTSTTVKELKEIKTRLKIGTVRKIKKDTKLDIKYKHYRIENKFDAYVGKDSKSNDLLTTRFAKQNDYWFHARGLPGSHVILRSDNPKEVIPKPVLKKAAAIAAYHSKAKTAGIVPVSYTFAKFVYKKKGLEPGQVYLTKENVLTVQPGIPADCELINE
jgi:predicted ribosome quality control (RQC) complex YloA/Tae2 family protein